MERSIDKRIEDALAAGSLNDQNMTGMLADAFRSRLCWLNVLTAVWALVIFGVGVFCLVRLLASDDAVMSIRWALGVTACMIGVGMIKTWFWLLFARNVILRELKRLELRMAQMADGEGA